MSKPKAAVVEYMGSTIRLGDDGLYNLNVAPDKDGAVRSHTGLNLVGAKSIVLAQVQKDRHRQEWGVASDYEKAYLIEVGKAHWLKSGKWSTLCGEGPRKDWLRVLPIDLGKHTMCKSCVKVFAKRVF